MLNERGARATGADTFPTKAQLDETDVLILHKQEAGNVDEPDRKNLNEYLARGGGLVVIHAGTVSRDPDWFSDDRRRLVAKRHDEVARRADAAVLHGPREPDHERTRRTGRWTTRSTTTWTCCRRRGCSRRRTRRRPPARATPGPAAPRRRAHGRRKARRHLRHPAADVDLREDRRGRTRAVSRVRLDPRSPVRELQPRELPGDPAARHRVGGEARRTWTSSCKKEELGDALRYVDGGPTHPSKAAAKLEVHPDFNLTLVAAEPLIAKAMNIDWDERGTAVGVGDAGVSRTAGACRTPRRGRTPDRSSRAGRSAIPRTRSRSSPTRTATA